jgi:hypothetical protein
MNMIDPDIWPRLAAVLTSGDNYAAAHAIPNLTDRLYCALDADKAHHLLVVLHSGEEELHDENSRGVAVDSLEMLVKGQLPAKYIDIKCRETSGHSILDLMGTEIAEGLQDVSRQPSEIVKRVLAKWRRFWGQVPQNLLSREEQLGLFAELWFLAKWKIPHDGPDAVLTWKGPWGGRNDFEWHDNAVEVKATAASHGRRFHVNGIRQLENPENGQLYLFSVVLHEEAGASNTLPVLIHECREIMQTSPDALTWFEEGLIRAAYSPIHDEEYSKLHLAVLKADLFIVDQDFPRLIPSSFIEGIPAGVEEIDYVINLDAFNHLIVADSPERLPF